MLYMNSAMLSLRKIENKNNNNSEVIKVET